MGTPCYNCCIFKNVWKYSIHITGMNLTHLPISLARTISGDRDTATSETVTWCLGVNDVSHILNPLLVYSGKIFHRVRNESVRPY
jgi:hypothetical protein